MCVSQRNDRIGESLRDTLDDSLQLPLGSGMATEAQREKEPKHNRYLDRRRQPEDTRRGQNRRADR